MKNKIKIFFIIVITTLFASCKTKKLNNNVIVNSNQNKTIDTVYNSDKSMILILDYFVTKNPIITYNYSVIDSKTKKELIKGVFTGDTIEWLNKDTLKCKPYVGMIKKESDVVLRKKQDQKTKYITIQMN